MNRIQYFSLAGLLLASLSWPNAAMNRPAVDEVLKLQNAGLGEDSIVAFIQRQNVDYALSAEELILLKNQGVTSPVLAAMVKSGTTRAASSTPAGATSIPAAVQPTTPISAVTAPTVVPATALTPTPPAAPLNPDAAYFYQQLSPYGRWLLGEDNQWYWQPTVVVTDRNWRPYWDKGHWIWTDSGWYWASDYSWGWAAFHYGRWRLHPLHGWVWMPDRVWAPAWVTWRAGGDYCGWAPLPPGTYFDPAGALLFRGRHVTVEFDFGLDWHHFAFCEVRELGEHRLHLHRDAEREAFFHRTSEAHHVSAQKAMLDNHNEVRVFNHGVDPARVASVKGHRMETVTIQDLHAPAPNRSHERFDKDRHTLEVYRPRWGEPGRGPM
jgi:hypothetical protein